MKYCNKCGNKLKDSAKFCNKCGNKIIKVENTNNIKDNIINNESSKNNKEYNKTNFNNSNKIDINKNEDNLNNTNSIRISIDKLNKDKLYNDINNNLNNDKNEHFISNNQNNNYYSNPTSFKNTRYENQHKSKTKYIIISIIIIIILSIASFLYLSKDSILYKYYFNKANSAASTFDKLTDYNISLKYNYNNEVINSIYDTLKSDSSFIDEIPKLSNLNKDDTNKLIYKLCILYADKNFNSGNYDACLNYLKLAEEHGYNIKDYRNYNELKEKLETSKEDTSTNSYQNIYSFENSNPVTTLPKNIYDYDGDYISPYSDSTYISKSDISQYNKSTLALMRNEIYARHGYIFTTEPYKSYFNSKSWYTPDPSFKGDDKELNEYELENVRTIKSVEDSK